MISTVYSVDIYQISQDQRGPGLRPAHPRARHDRGQQGGQRGRSHRHPRAAANRRQGGYIY